MLFGLMKTPSTFQLMMDYIFHDWKLGIVYLDFEVVLLNN